MFTRYRTHGLCVFLFFLGILIGGSMVASLPHPNRIHLQVNPRNGMNIRPEIGDTIDWTVFGNDTPPTISFPYTGSPCTETAPGNICSYETADKLGVYYYTCTGSVSDCDPGMGPSSVTKGGSGKVVLTTLGPVSRLLDSLALSIDRTIDRLFGFLLTAHEPISLSAPGLSSHTPAKLPALTPLATDNPNGFVGCIGNQAQVKPDPINAAEGQEILWAGPAFTIAFADPSICKSSGDMSTPNGYQSCTMTNTTKNTAYPYTVKIASCTGQTTMGKVQTP